MGDGPGAEGLSPAATNLTEDHVQHATDGYLFYRISEGGNMEPYNSAMPSYGGQFSDDQIWELVSHIRSY